MHLAVTRLLRTRRLKRPISKSFYTPATFLSIGSLRSSGKRLLFFLCLFQHVLAVFFRAFAATQLTMTFSLAASFCRLLLLRRTLRESLRRASMRRQQAEERAMKLARAAGAVSDGPRALQFSIVPSRPEMYPLLVFVNPKSGGNQGAKLMQQMLWHLNPRQVFNLMALTPEGKVAGPRPGLEHFKVRGH